MKLPILVCAEKLEELL